MAEVGYKIVHVLTRSLGRWVSAEAPSTRFGFFELLHESVYIVIERVTGLRFLVE